MQLSVSDDRPFPLGWSAWSESVACKMNCVTREAVTEYTRVCNCFVFKQQSGSVHNDGDVIDSTSAEFENYCKPCDGEATKQEPCEPTCDPVLVDSGSDLKNTFTTNDFHHHRCCEESTAIRVMAKNYFANQLSFSGV